MKTRKLVRRAIFTAALSTASLIPSVDSRVIAFESGMRTSGSSIQLVQYQTGQPASGNGQPNASVTAELKRMFEENGQPMPSMNPRDLPNAQGQQGSNIRPTQRPGMQSNTPQNMSPNMAQASKAAAKPPAPPETNVLKRFMSKVTGREKKAAEAAVIPPVPPGYREPAPAPPAGGAGMAQNQNGRQGLSGQGQQNNMQMQGSGNTGVAARPASSSQGISQHVRPQPNAGTAASAPVRTAQAGQPGGQVRTANQPSQPVPAVPNPARTPGKVVPQQGQVSLPQYVQPGAAPGFMPSTSTASAAVVQAPPKAAPKSQPAAPNIPADDEFNDLFIEGDAMADAADTLDLDSIMQQPDDRLTPSNAEMDATETVRSDPPANTGDRNPFEESEARSSGAAVEENPLTGVRLGAVDEDSFNAAAVPRAISGAVSSGKEQGDFGDASPPMDDFESGLPAIDLPTVEDFTQTAEVAPAVQSDLNFPELDKVDAAEIRVKIPASSRSEEFRPEIETVKVAEAPMKSANTEKLQQVAEQDRRVRQQRMIQSRAGQAGFKGFCPVELRDRRELVDTDPQYSATFGLQTYTFSSAAAKTAFEGDPSRYAPAAGGSDVVLLVNSGEEQPGMLDYALWYRDRLYLFRSRETMAMFNSDPLRFANQY